MKSFTELELEHLTFEVKAVTPDKRTQIITLATYLLATGLDKLIYHRKQRVCINGLVHYNYWLLTTIEEHRFYLQTNYPFL